MVGGAAVRTITETLSGVSQARKRVTTLTGIGSGERATTGIAVDKCELQMDALQALNLTNILWRMSCLFPVPLKFL